MKQIDSFKGYKIYIVGVLFHTIAILAVFFTIAMCVVSVLLAHTVVDLIITFRFLGF